MLQPLSRIKCCYFKYFTIQKIRRNPLTNCLEEASSYDDSIGGSEGGHGKVDLVREVVRILLYKSVPKANKGERGSKNSKISRMALMDAPKSIYPRLVE